MQKLATSLFSKVAGIFFISISQKSLTIQRKRCIIYSGGERYDRYRKCPSGLGKCSYYLGRIRYNIPTRKGQTTTGERSESSTPYIPIITQWTKNSTSINRYFSSIELDSGLLCAGYLVNSDIRNYHSSHDLYNHKEEVI